MGKTPKLKKTQKFSEFHFSEFPVFFLVFLSLPGFLMFDSISPHMVQISYSVKLSFVYCVFKNSENVHPKTGFIPIR